MDVRIRQLRIKSGIVKRLSKERSVYAREAEQQREQLNQSRTSSADEYVIKKQEEVLREALMMIPDCDRRLTKAQTELKDILSSERDLEKTEDYIKANQILNESIEQSECDKVLA